MSGAARKRERENPCGVCGHYHKYEEGEVCGICGHRMPASTDRPTAQMQGSAFPTTVLADFLYLGSYDHASRCELLKTQGITHILNTVPACQNLYKNSFTYHCLQDDKSLQFDDAIQFLEKCERVKARVLVHCMSGKNRSPAIVIAYLMKSKGWRLAQSFQWVKERRPQVELTEAARQELMEYEWKIFGSDEPPVAVAVAVVPAPALSSSTTDLFQPFGSGSGSGAGSGFGFGFGFPKTTTDVAPLPVFDQPTTASIFNRVGPINPANFVFGTGTTTEQQNMGNNAFGMIPPDSNEAPMDST